MNSFALAGNPGTLAVSPLAQARRLGGIDYVQDGLSEEEAATVREILGEKYEYMDHPAFELPREEAEEQLFDDPEPIGHADVSWYHPAMSWIDEPRLGRSATKTLTAAEERVIFAQFNYCRFRVFNLKQELVDQTHRDPALVREMLTWYEKAEGYREQIAGLNLALVLAMAKRIRGADVDWGEMISEGNMALLRSIDKFDITRGFKFSTYACRAILKAFSRQGIKHSKYRSTFPTDFDPKFERSNHQSEKNEEHETDCVDELREIIRRNKASLSDVERGVIERRFAVGDNARIDAKGDPRPLTLEQVGKILGVTKERVRQIQTEALDKIRDHFEGDFLR
ncbi:sigma-70 family RNA polymerase sigma factor [Phycisphaera mikurensis]|uniref:Putative RNA polymerase sigma factor n=1 Tax=Phycisphaera mikurensis (strain NBRC 102666 / KCTC 22515 / FYK2301M01) TaxID=1142394 RepID=I0IDI0_PHYMF|nr:sigma-70 family RNA polymerase sigma factor [Phycisphaera mikurensis]MBB6441139.1 RNA polymerase sigma factor (sigma-70 family) [Phycisphaera mikurensis]BAM03318.1 putative RNA polymerase sigma factor [Phycisphaera mikurensis NBRC 102666]